MSPRSSSNTLCTCFESHCNTKPGEAERVLMGLRLVHGREGVCSVLGNDDGNYQEN
jgi:hypothetical protein